MYLNNAKIKELRLDKGWTQQQLADACGVSMRTVQRVEKDGVASVDTTAALCAVFERQRRELMRLSTEITAPGKASLLRIAIISGVIGFVTGIVLTVTLLLITG